MVLLALAAVMGSYSGITTDSLLDTPNLEIRSVWQAGAADLLRLARNAILTEHDNQAALRPEAGFALDLDTMLAPGIYRLTVQASAPNKGADSLFVDLDGTRLKALLQPPIEHLGPSSIVLHVEAAGNHRIALTLRESPGCVLQSVSLEAIRPNPPLPAILPERRDSRPRVLLTPEKLALLRRQVATGAHAEVYALPSPLTRPPPAYRPGKRNGGGFRSLGDHVLRQLLDPDPAQLEAIEGWLETGAGYGDVGVDLDAEYFLEGMALAYDWLHDALDRDLRDRVRDRVARSCAELYQASLAGRTGGGLSFQQNHFWYAHLALALGAAALVGDHPEAESWLAWSWDRFERIALTFSPDGSFHEGPGYWDFSMPTLYMYTDLYESLTGQRAPEMDRGLHGQAEFRLHHILPGFRTSVPLEDSSVALGPSAPWLWRWEAARYRDADTQGQAALISRGPSSSKYALLWHDPAVTPPDAPLDQVPLARHYADVENVFLRTSWAPDATFAAFACRPLGGHRYADICSRYPRVGGTGHNHPAQGHFFLYARGQTLAGDPGYTYEKRTRNHNTILVDGQGQYGDGEMWPSPKPGRPRILRFVHRAPVSIVTGEVADAYPKELGLREFQRTFVLVGPDLAVVFDRLAAEQPRTFSWLLHHWGEERVANGRCRVTVGNAVLDLQPLLPASASLTTEVYRPQFVHPTRDLTPKNPDVRLVSIQSPPATTAFFLVPMTIGSSDQPPAAAEHVPCDGGVAMRCGDTILAFRTGPADMTVPLPWGGNTRSEASVLVAVLRDGQRIVVDDTPPPRTTGDGG
ncbi:MAG: DUF4962 domain-containing protein [Lentisphaeria bacterium]|nr:DUF4962 domain-containing protein [Lentisphaeria bacterium]